MRYVDGFRLIALLQASASLQLCTHPLTYLETKRKKREKILINKLILICSLSAQLNVL